MNILNLPWFFALILSISFPFQHNDSSFLDGAAYSSTHHTENTVSQVSEKVEEDITFLYQETPIMRVKRSELSKSFYDFPLLDLVKLQKTADQLNQLIHREPVNATLDRSGQIITEQPGLELNKQAFIEQTHRHFYENRTSPFVIPVRKTYPRVDSELLSNIRTNMVGHYVTYFNSGNKERSNNIYLAAKAINNFVVFPGETFSFNKAVGKRTKAKGYQIAPIIVRGELSEDIGGGICQVSSTLFNAVDRSGLKVLERFSHSKRVPYVPPGRDATVSWYGPDFTFKNQYNQPILIRTKVSSGIVIVLVFSSEDINVKKNRIPSADAKLPPETELKTVNY